MDSVSVPPPPPKKSYGVQTDGPKTLKDLLVLVKLALDGNELQTPDEVLLGILQHYHYWPALQVKRFGGAAGTAGLVLLHNTYKRVDVEEFKELYDECRSVVLDLLAPEGENIIISLANTIPERQTLEAFRQVVAADGEARDIAASYEGTTIHVYSHKGRWYFGTAGCASVDSSRYSHPTKTHGVMMNEALERLFPDAAAAADGESAAGGVDAAATARRRGYAVRNAFTAYLDPLKSYAFILVHHENTNYHPTKSLYAEEFERADYAVLLHIQTRDRDVDEIHGEEMDIAEQPLSPLGIRYPRSFETAAAAIEYMDQTPHAFGLIYRSSTGALVKVAHERQLHQEESHLGNPNQYVNMLGVYLQNKAHYHVSDYIQEYGAPEPVFDSAGREMAPTYMIHTVICTIRDILYGLYSQTTEYFKDYKRFRMNKDIDARLPPMLRFHLAQLRHIQISSHTEAYLTPKAVFHYLCFHTGLKNVRQLIQFFANSYQEQANAAMTARQAECFALLAQQLAAY